MCRCVGLSVYERVSAIMCTLTNNDHQEGLPGKNGFVDERQSARRANAEHMISQMLKR